MPDRHARPLARPADDRRLRGRGRPLLPEADQRRRRRGPGDAGGRPQAQAGGADRHAAPQHAAPGRGEGPDHRARGSSGRSRYVEIYCYYHMRAKDTTTRPRRRRRRRTSITRCGPAPRRCGRTTSSSTRGRWRAFMEYGNGIVGDMCVHMLDMTRWMLGLGWPKRVGSSGGILVDKASKANITDTQTATFDFDGLPVVWHHRTWGDAPIGMAYDVTKKVGPCLPPLPVGRHHLRRQGHARSQRHGLHLHPRRRRRPDPQGREERTGRVPRGQDRRGPRTARRPRHPRAT